jgi:hypothetical protein
MVALCSAVKGPAGFADKLSKCPTSWTATGESAFLNEWTYKLGEEVLTPFGRKQLCERPSYCGTYTVPTVFFKQLIWDSLFE